MAKRKRPSGPPARPPVRPHVPQAASAQAAIVFRTDSLNEAQAALDRSDFVAAEAAARKGLGVGPDARLERLLGRAVIGLGRPVEGHVCFARAMGLAKPGEPIWLEAAGDRARLHMRMSQNKEAAALYAQVVPALPDHADHHRFYGVVLRRLGRIAEAEPLLRKAAELDPKNPDAITDLAWFLEEVGRGAEGRDIAAKAIETLGCDPALVRLLAVLERRHGRYKELIAWLQSALADRRDNVALWRELAHTVAHLDGARSVPIFREILRLTPDDFDAIVDLANRLQRTRGPEEAKNIEEAYQLAKRALDLKVTSRGKWKELHEILTRVSDFDRLDMLGSFSQLCLEWTSKNVIAGLHGMLGQVRTPEDRILLVDSHRRCGEQSEAHADLAPLPPRPAITGRAKVRIGFMSSDLRNHPVSYFTVPLLVNMDRSKFEIYCYSWSTTPPDAVQQHIMKTVDVFRQDAVIGNRAAAQMIANDDLDILFELGGSTHMNKIDVMAWRPAPRQASWLGYVSVSASDRDMFVNIESVYGGSGADNFVKGSYYARGGLGNDSFDGGGMGYTMTLDYTDRTVGVAGTMGINGFNVTVGTSSEIDWAYNVFRFAGGSGDDNMFARDWANVWYSMWGGGGNDTLINGGANNTMWGGDGNDSIAGDNGSEVLYGDAGNDVFDGNIYGRSAGNDTYYGGDGNDCLYGGTGTDLLYGDAGDDTIINNGAGNSTLYGGTGNDTLSGGGGNNLIYGDAGNDTIDGGAGSDTIYGGAGNDSILGGANDDILQGGAGSDTIDGGTGLNTLSYAGSLGVTVDLGANTVTGGDATGDVIRNFQNVIGTDYADSVMGNAADNTLTGGGGADTLDGGAGLNTLSYAGSLAVTIDLGAGTASGGDATGDVFRNFQNVIGSDYADAIIGSAVDNTLQGGLGNDTIDGGAGNDVVEYGYYTSGVSISFAAGTGGTLSIIAGAETDVVLNVEAVRGSGYADTIVGSGAMDVLFGGAGNDSLIGSASSSWLDGGDGNDTVNGDIGKDTLYGGAGNDSLFGGAEDDILQGGAGLDTLDGGAGLNTLSYAGSLGVTVHLGANTVTGGDATGDVISNFQNVIGSDYADSIVGSSADNSFQGGLGNDTFDGGAGSDTVDYSYYTSGVNISLAAGSGATISIRAGSETDVAVNIEAIRGSAYADTIDGTGVNENIYGGAGNDSIAGSTTASWLDGGLGDDTIVGGAGSDTIVGGGGADKLSGGAGNDMFTLDAGSLSLTTTNTSVDGGTGTDTIVFSGSSAFAAADLARAITNVEVLDFRGANVAANLTFAASDLTALTGASQELTLRVDANDSIAFDSSLFVTHTQNGATTDYVVQDAQHQALATLHIITG